MPYIKQEHRIELDAALVPVLEYVRKHITTGDLNYIIMALVKTWWKRNPRYATIAEISGVLSNVESEFYRRVAVPYEDTKIAENGDVYSV